MSEAIKPTPGPWAVARMTPCRVDTASGSISISWSSNNDSGAREREAEANARLIAEAGTVFHNTGLSPRQLVERVKELEGALRAYESARSDLFSHTFSNGVFNAWGQAHDCRALNDAHLQARAALAKCEGNQS